MREHNDYRLPPVPPQEYYYPYPPELLGPAPNPCPAPSPAKKEESQKCGYEGEGPSIVSRPPLLAPIPPQLPPKHTQIQPRCFTCKHFEMCGFKRDYLKTVTLVQHSLGSPQEDYEWTTRYITIPEFVGFPMINEEKHLPKEVTFDNSDHTGKLFLAKFNGINYVNIVYKDAKYYILIQLVYDNKTELYELKSCKEAFYKVDYELNKKSLEEIQLGLVDWRVLTINAKAPAPPPRKDVINTTHFSASLECDMYDWNKDSFDEAVTKLMKQYPQGIPIADGDRMFYHIATYHVANGEVPYAPLFHGDHYHKPIHYVPPQPALMKPNKPPKRRGDI